MAKLTALEVLERAIFLQRWAGAKPISKLPGSTFHSKGKFMTKIDQEMSELLRATGYAKGSETRFVMDKAVVKAAEKAAKASGMLVKMTF